MKKLFLSLILFIIAISSVNAQQGINYKAIITNNGTIIQNQNIDIQFTILENGATNVYQEEHTVTTNVNGIIILNIGEGAQISGDFNTVNWREEQFLNVKIDIGSGYSDFGTTAFKTVPHAKSAEKLLPTDKIIVGETDTYLTEKLYVKNANPDSELVDFRVGDLTSGKDVLNLYIDQNTSGNRSQFIEATKGNSLKFRVNDDGATYSKTGFNTDGYLQATGDIETFSNMKTWGNLEVDGNITVNNVAINGQVTTNLNLGNNEINATSSGNADMKAFAYGAFYVAQNGFVDLIEEQSSDGFTVSRESFGNYKIQFDNTSIEMGDLALLVSITKSTFDYTPTLVNARVDLDTDHFFNIYQYDLNGNTYEGAPGLGYDAIISFVIYKK